MAISSVLNPETIIGKQNNSVSAAQNFISGGLPIGSSVVGTAANKIVGFERAAVKPVSPDVNNIISTITNNVLNEVDNSIKSATNITNQKVDNSIQNLRTEVYSQINQVASATPVTQLQTVVQNIQSDAIGSVQKAIDGFSLDYQEKIRKVDASKPIGIVEKFLSTYKNAIDFIQFFSNKKNLAKLSESLVALKKSFTDSFELSKLIRQVIQKIVTQLTSLPKATPGGGGGINLDVNLPGNTLRKSAPKGFVSKRGKMLALGAGALGLGAVGSATVNALSDSDRLQPGLYGLSPSEDSISAFSDIVNRFSEAINFLLGLGKTSEKKGSLGSGSLASGPSGPPGSPPGPSGPSGPPADVTVDSPEEKAWLQTLRKVEGTSDSGGYQKLVGGEVVPELTQMTLQEVYDLGMKGRIGEGTLPSRFGNRKVKFGADSHAMGAYQFKPQTMMGVAKNLGLDPKTTLFSPEIQDKLALSNLRSIGVDPSKKADIRSLDKAQRQWAGLGPYYGQTRRTLQQSLEIFNQYYGTASTSTKPGVGGPDLPDIMLPPEKRDQYRSLATNVSQPPPSQQTPQINFIPLSIPGSGISQASRPSGPSVSSPPAPAQDGTISIPNLPSGNPDNFLVLYSKMVYNIVDG